MKILRKILNLLVVAVLIVAASGYFFVQKAAAVNGILDHRSIQMSSSVTSATNVQYITTFNYGTSPNQTLGGVAIEFCSGSPLPGDTCSTPGSGTPSFNVNAGTAGILASQTGVTGWTVDTVHSTQRAILLNRTPSSVSSGTTQVLTFGDGSTKGFTNPNYTNPNTTFYARIYTFTTNFSTTWNSTSPGSYTDFGGLALSTAAQLTITAKVQEQLTLCVYTASNCAGGGTAITLGDANGVLSVSSSYTNITGKFDASTNAAQGMNIYDYGGTLTSAQGNTIAAIGPTAAGSSTGSEQFGFCLWNSSGTGSVAPATPYNNASCNTVTTGANTAGSAQFAYDITTPGTNANLLSLGGEKIASTSSPTASSTMTLAYLANIAPTTKAGVYTTTQTFIAVGFF